MMSLSNTTGYAIRALACVANCTKPPTSIKAMAQCADVSEPYLAKIVKKLNEAGILESKRGNRGGTWLTRPAKMISLLDICEALEGADFLGSCLLGSEFCKDQRDCPTHDFWIKNKELIKKELARIKLSDVLELYRSRNIHQMTCC